MTAVTVRPATAADVPEWSAMRAQLWPDDDAAAHAADIAETFLSGDPDQVAFVAEGDGGALLGFVEASIRRDYVDGCDTSPVAFGEGAFILPQWRGTGVGRALVAHALERHPMLTTEVNEQNGQAVGFYERLGFVPTGRSERDGQGRAYPLIHLRFARKS